MTALLRRWLVPGAGLRLAPLRLAERVLEWHEQSRQRAMLATLDAHLLRDIGLTAADVAEECRKPFWRR